MKLFFFFVNYFQKHQHTNCLGQKMFDTQNINTICLLLLPYKNMNTPFGPIISVSLVYTLLVFCVSQIACVVLHEILVCRNICFDRLLLFSCCCFKKYFKNLINFFTFFSKKINERVNEDYIHTLSLRNRKIKCEKYIKIKKQKRWHLDGLPNKDIEF